MINGISIVCFAASYAVALCLEISRLFFRISLRTAIMVGFVLAGLVAHSIYLTREAQQGFAQGAPLSSWYHGCLIVAWLLAATYVTLSLWKKPTAIGLFFLPTILALVAIAQVFPRQPQLTSEAANRVWSLVHGVALLLGTAAVMVGFLGGVLYLVQSYRLKHKIVASRGLRLPSLEILQRVCEGALIASCCLLLVGLIAGILLNWRPGEQSVVSWTDPVVWPSGVLLLWLLVALTFNAVYKPARQGRKVAYLTMASFIFLGLVLAILLFVQSAHRMSGRRAFGGEGWDLGLPTSYSGGFGGMSSNVPGVVTHTNSERYAQRMEKPSALHWGASPPTPPGRSHKQCFVCFVTRLVGKPKGWDVGVSTWQLKDPQRPAGGGQRYAA